MSYWTETNWISLLKINVSLTNFATFLFLLTILTNLCQFITPQALTLIKNTNIKLCFAHHPFHHH